MDSQFKNFNTYEMDTIEYKLEQFNEAFLFIIKKIKWKNMYAKMIKDILAQRENEIFKSVWIELNNNRPCVENCHLKQIKRDIEKIQKAIPKNLDQELAKAICADYDLMASYLISGQDNKRISGMFTSYVKKNIPVSNFLLGYRNLQYALHILRTPLRVARMQERIIQKRNLKSMKIIDQQKKEH